jgi:hypothetical protein
MPSAARVASGSSHKCPQIDSKEKGQAGSLARNQAST